MAGGARGEIGWDWGTLGTGLLAAILTAGCAGGSGLVPGPGPSSDDDTRSPATGGPPRIISLSTDIGDAMGGEVITISTMGFRDDFRSQAPVALFGTLVAESTPLDATTIEVVTVAHAPGPVDLEVRSTGEAESAVADEAFTFDPGPPGQPEPPLMGHCPTGGPNRAVFVLDRTLFTLEPGEQWIDYNGLPAPVPPWETAVIHVVSYLSSHVADAGEFGIVVYDCDVQTFQPALVSRTTRNMEAAVRWLLSLGPGPSAEPGTGPAVETALRMLDPGPDDEAEVWLLSRYRPDCGLDDLDAHRARALSEWRGPGTTVHTIGLGDFGYAAAFLRDLAESTGGEYGHSEPQ